MTNANANTTIASTNTAIVSAPSNTPPASLQALERYGRSAGSLYGELLKFSGKTGAWTSGAQGGRGPDQHPARGDRARNAGWLRQVARRRARRTSDAAHH